MKSSSSSIQEGDGKSSGYFRAHHIRRSLIEGPQEENGDPLPTLMILESTY